ncbi:PepSY domain-containing protein [Endozoicomonas numazuensis]|uniref:PepSY domain-containing protein n=1 Tax=Endozoicomonas numazuensis TaxID=1137799 RepID=UPI00068EF217|nr:PepSY domain-containing protein [Endozoicomonas numazuensis]
MMESKTFFFLVAMFMAFCTSSFAKPPVPVAKPLSHIIKMLEGQGYRPIVDVSMNDGLWVVEAYKGSEKRALKVNPDSGEVVSDRPDD